MPICCARSYSAVPARARAEPKTDTAWPSSDSRPKPSTNSAWIRSTRHGSVCTQSLGPRQSSNRWSVVVFGMCLPRNVAGPMRRSRRLGSECRLMALKVAAPATWIAQTPGQVGVRLSRLPEVSPAEHHVDHGDGDPDDHHHERPFAGVMSV